MTSTPKKPTLYTLHGSKVMELEYVLEFYKRLTGRDPSAKEVEEARRAFEAMTKADGGNLKQTPKGRPRQRRPK